MKYRQTTPLLMAMLLACSPLIYADSTTTVAMAAQQSMDASTATSTTLIPLHAAITAKGKSKKKPAPVSTTNNAANPTDTLDVTQIDQRIGALEAKAQHYPPSYTDKRERHSAEADVKDLVSTIDQYAVAPNASAEVLMRAVKVNQMARNMDVGTESALKAGVYMRRLIALQPTNPEANYWYGIMLSEGGGVKEGIPYLNKAAKNGFKAAYLSLAHAYLMLTKKPEAISALESYRTAVPENKDRTETLLEGVRSGSKTGIW
jgi:tetratricopeptide (TPR) repeat protein